MGEEERSQRLKTTTNRYTVSYANCGKNLIMSECINESVPYFVFLCTRPDKVSELQPKSIVVENYMDATFMIRY